MSLVTDHLLQLVAGRPVRHIKKNGAPYLSRYHMRGEIGERQAWLHRFHSSDGDDMLHNHAWLARSWVIQGGYGEQYVSHAGIARQVRRPSGGPVDQVMRYDQVSHILDGSRWLGLDDIPGVGWVGPDRWHRVEWIEPETWTLLVVEPGRFDYWYFADPQGCGGEPSMIHDEVVFPEGWALRSMLTEGEDWFTRYDATGARLATPATL